MTREATIAIGFPAERRDAVAELLRRYVASLGIDLSFQSFDAEVAALPGAYAPPDGAFATAVVEGRLAGIVALRPLDRAAGICEMKRLYVPPEARGLGLGRRLALAAIGEARRLGYRTLRLDTMPSMREAQALYSALGFRDIAAYTFNPVAGARFMEVDLGAAAESGA